MGTNDADNDSMVVPAPNCGGTNLRMEKRATGTECTAAAGMLDCQFVVIVHNTGPGAYSGNVTIADTVPGYFP